MELVLVFLTLPTAVLVSALAAALPSFLRARAPLPRSRWAAIGLGVSWGFIVFTVTVLAVTLVSASEYYTCAIGPESTLPPATIAHIKAHRMQVLAEYSLRIHLGTSKYDNTCHTHRAVCSMADTVLDQVASQYFTTGMGYGGVILLVGVATAVPAALVFGGVLLGRKEKPGGRADGDASDGQGVCA